MRGRWAGAGRCGVTAAVTTSRAPVPCSAWRRFVSRVALLALVALVPMASALPPSPMFERVGDVEQVPEGVVTGLAQDGEGLLWIATTGG